MNCETLALTNKLINRESITPVDAGCQQLMIDYLNKDGFNIETMPFGAVSNFWATHSASASNVTPHPVFLFAGHTDVVPAGDLAQWDTAPFIATEKNGFLYGRGAADMKSSLASMLIASRRFIKSYPEHRGTIAFLITSDEEGPFVDGTIRVLKELIDRGQKFDYCIVGEPSSIHTLGDQIRIGRRGSLSGCLTVHGVQGHVAYPEQAVNSIHHALQPLQDLNNAHWDDGNDFFPPTSFQITNFSSGTAGNVVPGSAEIRFNFRFSTEQTETTLKKQVSKIIDASEIDYSLSWKLNGNPFLTKEGSLTSAVTKAIYKVTNIKPAPSTGGGTSDGRFIATTGAEVVELGHCSGTIHKVNEMVKISDLEPLSKIYFHILKELLL